MNISIENLSISINGKNLLESTNLVLAKGIKYGLVGRNGIGKSTLLKQMADGTIPIDPEIRTFYVGQEFEGSTDRSIFQIVSDANKTENDDPQDHIVKKLLWGLGFKNSEFDEPLIKFSGGYRTRVHLACGLYMNPDLLLLDEPTNHLDLDSVIWLRDYLSKWKKSLMIVSHDVNFLDQICGTIMHMDSKKLNYYSGNYTAFLKVREQKLIHNAKMWKKMENQIKQMRTQNANKKEIDELILRNKDFTPQKSYKVNINFCNNYNLNDPLINMTNMTFGYNGINLFENVNLCINNGDKIAIVGKNGIGKSTLLKLLATVTPNVYHHPKLRIGYYHQHLTETFPLEQTCVEYLYSIKKLPTQEIRKILGSTGLEGTIHNHEIQKLSGGQKSRLAFASIMIQNPNVLLLDEPTNHLDLETITSLIKAINNFNGAVVFVTHNLECLEKINQKIMRLNGRLVSMEFQAYCDIVLNYE